MQPQPGAVSSSQPAEVPRHFGGHCCCWNQLRHARTLVFLPQPRNAFSRTAISTLRDPLSVPSHSLQAESQPNTDSEEPFYTNFQKKMKDTAKATKSQTRLGLRIFQDKAVSSQMAPINGAASSFELVPRKKSFPHNPPVQVKAHR